MIRFLLTLLMSCFILLINAQDKQVVGLDDIWKKGTFRAESVYGMTFLNDGNYSEQVGNKIIKYNLKTRKEIGIIFDGDGILYDGKPLTIEGYSFNEDESLMLLETSNEKVYRHSYWSDNYVFDRIAAKLVRLS